MNPYWTLILMHAACAVLAWNAEASTTEKSDTKGECKDGWYHEGREISKIEAMYMLDTGRVSWVEKRKCTKYKLVDGKLKKAD